VWFSGPDFEVSEWFFATPVALWVLFSVLWVVKEFYPTFSGGSAADLVVFGFFKVWWWLLYFLVLFCHLCGRVPLRNIGNRWWWWLLQFRRRWRWSCCVGVSCLGLVCWRSGFGAAGVGVVFRSDFRFGSVVVVSGELQICFGFQLSVSTTDQRWRR
jgi:hypothetical protein